MNRNSRKRHHEPMETAACLGVACPPTHPILGISSGIASPRPCRPELFVLALFPRDFHSTRAGRLRRIVPSIPSFSGWGRISEIV
jgi:hypothetical protein